MSASVALRVMRIVRAAFKNFNWRSFMEICLFSIAGGWFVLGTTLIVMGIKRRK